MAIIVLHSELNSKGVELKIVGDLEAMEPWVQELIKEERSENATDDSIFEDMVGLAACLSPDDDWKAIMATLERKKDDTFKKGRVKQLYRGNSWAQEWEDSYGYGAPEIRIKVIDDTTAEIHHGWYVEKW
ncbi:MAG: hypothetical protein K0R18_368 [Bacillales bacterium]|jgi:hypothetical protein|nr:hypothetical protein [Bacillales bacterium]